MWTLMLVINYNPLSPFMTFAILSICAFFMIHEVGVGIIRVDDYFP
eukprot:CAMPEP_0114565792 /NCGR_PEP_ID=MMETSP0114-20121206/14513_1 /TAXON_ID=31324 /ORGANISM="Goniomonas sp, Strain m" /LENGTH=45 /DNA_ID= /DNA_START= /DNA_END= /DNA_ORIENTATION=